MNRQALGLGALALALLAGCKTTETRPVSWSERSAYLGQARDPRTFGFSIYQTPGGVEFRGGLRLRPNRGAALPMKAKEPLRPVVELTGSILDNNLILLDFSRSSGLISFDLAQELHAVPVSEGEAQPVKRTGEKYGEVLSVVPLLKFDQLVIGSLPLQVRLAKGAIGPAARGIEKPAPLGVFGWDLLKNLEQIQLDYTEGKVLLSTSKAAYNPDPEQVFAQVPLVRNAGFCAVRAAVNGKETMVMIDPAGDFELAAESASGLLSVALGEKLTLTAAAPAVMPGGMRIGARLLKNYRVTVCPQAGLIYFENPEPAEEPRAESE